MNLSRLFLVALLAASLSACKTNKNGANGDEGGGAYAGDSDRVNGTPLSDRDEGVSFLDPSVSKNRFRPVHFAFDSFQIDGADRGVVRQVADFMQNGSNKVIIAGFCDERGTPEYNRALGENAPGPCANRSSPTAWTRAAFRRSASVRRCRWTRLPTTALGRRIGARSSV